MGCRVHCPSLTPLCIVVFDQGGRKWVVAFGGYFFLTWDAVQQVGLMFGIRVVALMYCRHRHDEHGWTFDCERPVSLFEIV
jgi:hypothetical protein